MGLVFRLVRTSAVCMCALHCGLLVADDGSRDAGLPDDAAMPLGTYSNCASGTVVSGPFLHAEGFDVGATLTLSQDGSELLATYEATGTFALHFTGKTSVSAALTRMPQETNGFASAVCVHGVGVNNETFFPTNFLASRGAMTYDSGVVFIMVQGGLTSHADCGDFFAPANMWIGCTDGPARMTSAPAFSLPFAAGDYVCTSQVGMHTTGADAFVTSGDTSGLTLTQSAGRVKAELFGGQELLGSLDFTPIGDTVARASPGQKLIASCDHSSKSNELLVSAASLALFGDTLILPFSGTMPSDRKCPAAEKIGAFVCTMK